MTSSLKKSEVVFFPTVIGKEYSINEMGDGLRSLFYISMVGSILDVEEKIRREIESDSDKKIFKNIPPILTIVAVEEPENHIAPHLIGKLINKFDDISSKKNSQIIITSHAPAIVKRLQPENLRYFRLEQDTLSTKVRSITVPLHEKLDEQYKYVKEAIKAYPELYFAELVILGEGDSEEIVLPKFFDIHDRNIDTSGISIVPLGGRHVNHFWRLLNDLEIPHITLLDLDKERDGGGWGRIKYVLEQLMKNGYRREDLLTTTDGILTEEKFSEMHKWNIKNSECLNNWINFLEKYNVFFSKPLDLDFLMLESYGDFYKSIVQSSEGPRIPGKGKIKDLEIENPTCVEYNKRILEDIRNALKECGGDGSTYTDKQRQLMVWYNYFFLNRGKPSTHILALSNIKTDELVSNTPSVIKKILEAVDKLNKLNDLGE